QMRSIASGKFSYSALCSPVAANALPGLRVHRRLRAGSPDRCAASPPGNNGGASSTAIRQQGKRLIQSGWVLLFFQQAHKNRQRFIKLMALRR
ncbi:MAG: hypothetical protein E7I52_08470, partial [Klebsiella michiganensis]|nr:hypothetical protein [Klebsiella michiganensis]